MTHYQLVFPMSPMKPMSRDQLERQLTTLIAKYLCGLTPSIEKPLMGGCVTSGYRITARFLPSLVTIFSGTTDAEQIKVEALLLALAAAVGPQLELTEEDRCQLIVNGISVEF